ncbi:MAG: alpha/beta fold hydrolase [Immundisolibacterales bacterium]|nr:alpha/beta fold hydrolase [Immundisolibacterales bacterium]
MAADHAVFELGETSLQCGVSLPAARLAYRTYGTLDASGDNVIVMPTFYTGTHARNEGYLRRMPALDPSRWFIVSINLFGNGLSSSPSNTAPPFDGPRFPPVTLFDNVAAQHRLLTEGLGVERVALVLGWSMAGCQAYQWGAQYPDLVDAILPFCASARTSPHNQVFLEGVKAALVADAAFAGGDYDTPPETGLRAFGRVYAGWAYSQTFYRERLHRELGFETWEELLLDWERDHLEWDANDLLAKLRTWQQGDISANERYRGDFVRALGGIRARAILVPCTTDLYFPPEDNAVEARHMPNAELRPYASAWGHCAATPSREDGDFMRFLDRCVSELLEGRERPEPSAGDRVRPMRP